MTPPGPPFPLPELTSRAWREEALARAAEIQTLSDWITGLPAEDRPRAERGRSDECLARDIAHHVQEAHRAARRGWPLLREGARLARAASNLHAAEADLLRRAPWWYLRGELPNLDAHVRRHLPVDDPRRLRVEDLARRERDAELIRRERDAELARKGEVEDEDAGSAGPSDRGLPRLDRESLIAAVRAACSAAEREQQRVRSFRTIVVAATAILFVIALFVGFWGAREPTLVPICFEPQQASVLVCPTAQNLLTDRDGDGVTDSGQAPADSGQAAADAADVGSATSGRAQVDGDVDDVIEETARPWDVPLIEGIGMVAAGVTGAVSLRRLRGSSTPFAVSVALTVLKLPTGALTAFLGLLLMRGGFIPGLTALDSTPQIIAWAVVFGASQQLVTGLVDRQAQTVLDSVGGKTYTPTGGS
ncbi:hypothetical protein JOD57_000992 [Geodermatophilus bullaregiensis]|uniref:hypothetical protein n=1 Tax=Geodermatophilus bullaregiensis TaxID=1564160 RepID=UPI00195C11DD|nr:hypothetical protein [Geodermatophilus bullaregiensis]MBM7805155.1 hypothetical protein [Geodermatophilus bullaregiensis]